MKKLAPKAWLAGVDGCKGGWIVAYGQLDGETRPPIFVQTIDEVAGGDVRPAIIAIDVPIGLPKRSPAGGRGPEPVLRSILKGRASSVFRVPSRRAVYAGVDANLNVVRAKYSEACSIARCTSEDGKAFALQSLYIFDKIASVDKFLRRHPGFVSLIYETHPELAFCYMNEKSVVTESKKSETGRELRRTLLKKAGIPLDVINARHPARGNADDTIDALACLVTARKIGKRRAVSHPELPCKDEHGLPMAVWA